MSETTVIVYQASDGQHCFNCGALVKGAWGFEPTENHANTCPHADVIREYVKPAQFQSGGVLEIGDDR